MKPLGESGRRREPGSPICPVCEQRVQPGEHVVFGHGDVIHLRCQRTAKDDFRTVQTFLEANLGRAYCGMCLGERLALAHPDVRKIIVALKMTERFKVAAAMCLVCGNPRVTIQARPSD